MIIDLHKVKIVVMVPPESVDIVRNTMCEAGAGMIGNYTYCSVATPVIGTFIPNDQANPYIGTQDKLEFVEEVKLEAVCEIPKAKGVIKHLKNVHPYEEPAIDIIPLIDETDL